MKKIVAPFASALLFFCIGTASTGSAHARVPLVFAEAFYGVQQPRVSYRGFQNYEIRPTYEGTVVGLAGQTTHASANFDIASVLRANLPRDEIHIDGPEGGMGWILRERQVTSITLIGEWGDYADPLVKTTVDFRVDPIWSAEYRFANDYRIIDARVRETTTITSVHEEERVMGKVGTFTLPISRKLQSSGQTVDTWGESFTSTAISSHPVYEQYIARVELTCYYPVTQIPYDCSVYETRTRLKEAGVMTDFVHEVLRKEITQHSYGSHSLNHTFWGIEADAQLPNFWNTGIMSVDLKQYGTVLGDYMGMYVHTQDVFDYLEWATEEIPEPSSVALLALSLCALGFHTRGRRRRHA